MDRCRVWESHADSGMDEPACMPADRVVVAVTAPPVGPGDL